MSASGPSRTSGDVRIAPLLEYKRTSNAADPTISIYEYTT
jgi:hypothetical protein